MFGSIRKIIWNVRLKGWSYMKNYAGVVGAVGAVWGSSWYAIYRTQYVLNNIVASRALDRERSGAPEYLYYNDPAHEQTLLQLIQDKGWSIWPYIGKFARRWRRAVLQRLMEVARDGDAEERMRALRLIKHMRLLKDWEVCWVSQRLDASSAVRLARMGAGPKLLGSPPLPPHLRSLPPHVPLTCLAQLNPNHHCLNAFLQKHNDNHQEVQQLMDSEGNSSRSPPDKEEEIREALTAALHHFSGALGTNNVAVSTFVQEGGLALLSAAARSCERDLQLTAARLLLCFSSHQFLLPLIHRAGLIQCLSEWLDGSDAELSCLAGGTLAGLEGDDWGPEETYGPTVQLLHPTHLTMLPPKLDVVTVHGLLGEPFVTWRQRDDTVEITEAIKMTDNQDKANQSSDNDNIENDFEFVLRDLPEASIRDTGNTILTHRGEKRIDVQEREELNERTQCWPRDWLPRDCPNIRVLGVSYDTVMTEWSEGECSVESGGGLEKRAKFLAEGLRRAGVGTRPILWIAHSMGGLLVKQMLVHSLQSNDEGDKRLASNTWGMIFYSTPHHGTRAAHALLWPSREVQDLREDSRILKNLHSVWLSGGWRCVCIAEGRPTKFMSGLPRLMLVPPSSADAGTGPCYILPLNHLDICKPATRRSFIYRQAVEMIRHALGERCRPEGCVECEHIGKEYNYYKALYTIIMDSIKDNFALFSDSSQASENKPKDSSGESSLQSWLLGILPF